MKKKIISIVVATCFWASCIPLATGCSATTVAQDIVNWTPSLQAAVATVDTTAALLLPPDAPIFIAATAGFDVASNLLVGQAKAYLANPSLSLLAQLENQAVAFQQQINSAVLAAGKIVNPATQQHVLSIIGVVVTIVTAIVGLINSIKGAVIIAPATAVTLLMIKPYRNEEQSVEIVANHYQEPRWMARHQIQSVEVQLAQAGL